MLWWTHTLAAAASPLDLQFSSVEVKAVHVVHGVVGIARVVELARGQGQGFIAKIDWAACTRWLASHLCVTSAEFQLQAKREEKIDIDLTIEIDMVGARQHPRVRNKNKNRLVDRRTKLDNRVRAILGYYCDCKVINSFNAA